MSSRLWEVGKKASIAGLVFVSLPVLVPSALLLALTGAVVVVPLGSAAVGYVVAKKILALRPDYLRLGWWSDSSSDGGKEDEEEEGEAPKVDRAEASTSSSSVSSKNEDDHHHHHATSPSAFGEISCEEVPEGHCPPAKSADDYIVVEKPAAATEAEAEAENLEQERSGGAVSQCKGAPDFFQCVEAEVADGVGGAAGMGDKGGGADVEEATDKEGSGSKNQAVGLSVLLGDGDKRSTPEQDHDDKKIAAPAAAAAAATAAAAADPVANQDHGKEDARSSVDEYVSMTEDFPDEPNTVSSDESVASAKNSNSATGGAAKPEVPEKEKRARLRKEIAALKKVTGYRDSAGGPLAGQVERLYGFMGVELPSGCSSGSDYGKLLEAVGALKAVVGVK